MKQDYNDEDILKHARESFSETIELKIKQLRKYIKKGGNPALTGDYIESLVRGFIKKWIGHRLILHGSFYSSEFENSNENPLQIDGIIYDPTIGPTIHQEEDFILVHPLFCTGIIEIKTSENNIKSFENRLKKIYDLYFRHYMFLTSQIMGVIITDSDPEKKSKLSENGIKHLYNYKFGGWCPIFILFKEKAEEYEPFYPAIDAMIRSIYKNNKSYHNYLD